MTFSIVIPSASRYDFLVPLLNELVNSIVIDYSDHRIEIIVVLPKSDPKIDVKIEYEFLKIIRIDQRSLSAGRNAALSIVGNDQILFLDDDVQLPEGFFDKLIAIIESEQFDCFGGMYYPWYPQGKPVWLPADFGKKTPLLAHIGPIDVHKDGFLSAGIMCVKREAIEAVGGFRTDLGMTNSIGYGEEDDLQLRLQAAGYQLGFVPDWWLYHAVLAHKHQVSWHLKSAYAHARDAQRIHQQHQLGPSLRGVIQTLAGAVLKRLPIGLKKYFFNKDYYWQNLVLDVLRPIYVYAGRLVGLMSSR
jgi:GT2 family glycosyltransferase